MQQYGFLEFEFLGVVIFSLILPAAILIALLTRKTISRAAVFLFGMLLILLSGLDFVILHHLLKSATHTKALMNDLMFGPALSVTLYLLPVVFAGIGTNLVSHILIRHLTEAEKRFEQERLADDTGQCGPPQC